MGWLINKTFLTHLFSNFSAAKSTAEHQRLWGSAVEFRQDFLLVDGTGNP